MVIVFGEPSLGMVARSEVDRIISNSGDVKMVSVVSNSNIAFAKLVRFSKAGMVDKMSVSVRSGYLEVYVNPTAESLNIQIKIYTPDIPVGDNITTGLTTTITFKIKQKHFTLPDTEEVYSPDWDTIVNNMLVVGTGILIVAGIGALVLTVGPEMGAAAVLFRTFLALFK